MTKALVVLTQPPMPDGGAPGKCGVALLRGLAAHGVDVRAIAARQHFAVPGRPPDDLPVEVVDVPPEPPWSARVSRLRRPRGSLGRGVFAEQVREAARDVDVVHLEEVETSWCDRDVAAPSLVHVHFLVRRDRSLGWPWSRQFRDVLEFAAAERAAARRHRYLVASSPLVGAALREYAPRAEVLIAPLSLDPRYYEPAPLDGPPVAGIIGTADWPPTMETLVRLLTRIWPLVRRRVPDACLRVAGRGTDRLAAFAEAPGVEIVGPVPSAPAFLRDLSVLVNPISRGSGVKVKVLEGIASGLPIVTTPAGAEGIEAGEGLQVAVDDARLVDAVVELLRDPEARRQRGALAREAFDLRYAPEPATEPLVELYRVMAEGDGAPARAPRGPTEPTAETPPDGRGRARAALTWLGGRSSSMPTGTVLVVSPHPDDAVFSLGATVAAAARRGREVTIATVFAGRPDADGESGRWDRRGGFSTEAEAALRRREEDRRACAAIGAKPVWLPFPDDQYEEDHDQDTVWAALGPLIEQADAVLVPAFPLSNGDHAWLAELVFRRSPAGVRLGGYVEQPYGALWSSRAEWVTRTPVLVPSPLSAWQPSSASLRDRLAKLEACRAYRSQIPLLGNRAISRIGRFELRRGGEPVAWLDG